MTIGQYLSMDDRGWWTSTRFIFFSKIHDTRISSEGVWPHTWLEFEFPVPWTNSPGHDLGTLRHGRNCLGHGLNSLDRPLDEILGVMLKIVLMSDTVVGTLAALVEGAGTRTVYNRYVSLWAWLISLSHSGLLPDIDSMRITLDFGCHSLYACHSRLPLRAKMWCIATMPNTIYSMVSFGK